MSVDYDLQQKRLEQEAKFISDSRETLMAQLNQRSQDVIDRYTQLITAKKIEKESAITSIVKSPDFLS